jgi:hypothetical protein
VFPRDSRGARADAGLQLPNVPYDARKGTAVLLLLSPCRELFGTSRKHNRKLRLQPPCRVVCAASAAGRHAAASPIVLKSLALPFIRVSIPERSGALTSADSV